MKTITHTKGAVVQSTGYYPFGLQTADSWTRDDAQGNSFLYNGSSEFNESTGNYETFFREYDPALGRMTAIDPLAAKYSSWSPYNFAFNDPVALNDPSGAEPYYNHDYIMQHEHDVAGRVPGMGNDDYDNYQGNDNFGLFGPGGIGRGTHGNNAALYGHTYLGSGGNWGDAYFFDGYQGYVGGSGSSFGSFLNDLYAASGNGISTFSNNDITTGYDIWSSLGEGEGFALNYGSNGSINFDTYRLTAGGNLSGFSRTAFSGAKYFQDRGNGMFNFGNDPGAYRAMRQLSVALNREISALVLDGDLIYIFPYENNTREKSYNNTWFDIIPAQIRGRLGIVPYTYAKIGNEKLRVLAQVHTHPDDVRLSGYDDERNIGDLTLSASWNIPVFVLGPNRTYYGQWFNGDRSFNRFFAKTNDVLNGTYSIRDKAKSILNSYFPF